MIYISSGPGATEAERAGLDYKIHSIDTRCLTVDDRDSAAHADTRQLSYQVGTVILGYKRKMAL